MISKGSAPRPKRSGHTRKFRQDGKRLQRSGRYPMEELKAVMRLLIENAGPLPPEYVDHSLQGDWRDYRDCHIRGDWLLIYRINKATDGEEIVFVRTGTHSELFG
jgi:mRNA interferase YafQ